MSKYTACNVVECPHGSLSRVAGAEAARLRATGARADDRPQAWPEGWTGKSDGSGRFSRQAGSESIGMSTPRLMASALWRAAAARVGEARVTVV